MSRTRLLGSLAVGLGAVAAAAEALTFQVHFPTDPLGPAAFPLVGAGLVALGALSLWRDPTVAAPWPAREGARRIGLATVSFLAYALLLAPLGFVVATTLEFAALASLFGGRGARSLVAGLAFALALFALFVYALGLPLPLGGSWTR